MRRRSLLASSVGLAGGLLWAPFSRAAPGSGHDAYFARLNSLLKARGPGRPVMLIDTERMRHNIDSITASVGTEKTYRAVVKSLPSVKLLEAVMARAKTRSLMVFHQPFLNEAADSFPDADVLLGKPMPVAAARTFYRKLQRGRFDAATQVQWLIDSVDRLRQYQALSRELGVAMRINFEIDVGLFRGGFSEPAALAAALEIIEEDPRLEVAGVMGYEPHLTGLKAELSHPAVQSVLGRYRGFVDTIRESGIDPAKLTLNGAGSHTLKIYERDRLMNDLAAGSGVVMPTDFDTFHLNDHRPALFIATPILKRYLENPVMADPPANLAQIYYIYGGYWKAKMVSPPSVGKPIYESTNQSPIGTGVEVDLDIDDYMFLRPTQSEFVMLQFGDLLTVTDGELDETWPVFHQTG